ncbi:unnamed protein product [Amoebophrya sp. A25]|nr:unnamed protein product [Amoebophrya sp. A25]|eukprot:GSA25T00024408001.1
MGRHDSYSSRGGANVDVGVRVLVANAARSNAATCSDKTEQDVTYCASISHATSRGPTCPTPDGAALQVCEVIKYAGGAGVERFEPGSPENTRTAAVQCGNKIGVVDLPGVAAESESGRVLEVDEVKVLGTETTTTSKAPTKAKTEAPLQDEDEHSGSIHRVTELSRAILLLVLSTLTWLVALSHHSYLELPGLA